MYKLRVKSNKTCSCGKECKLYSPKGYETNKCRCFFCEECWIDAENECPKCKDDISKWSSNIMKISECTICLLSKRLIKSPCKHHFCSDCWNETGKRKAECPHCRYNLTKWMTKRNINIGSENMYDEDSLPTMDLSGSFHSSIMTIMNSPHGSITISIYSPTIPDSESESIDDSSEDSDEPCSPRMHSHYDIENDLFTCGCGMSVKIDKVSSHTRSSRHINWLVSLAERA